jgi:DNA-binding GntR family transcriptional regulator
MIVIIPDIVTIIPIVNEKSIRSEKSQSSDLDIVGLSAISLAGRANIGTMSGGPIRNLPVKPISVISALAASIRERVLNGELAPEMPLPELDLATKYGVARPTIRAAIHQLTLTGLLRREPNRSAFVPRMSEEEITDLFAVRRILETEVVRLVTERRQRPSLAEQAVRKLESFPQDAKWSEVVEADLDFHRALVAATESPRLLRMFEMLEDEIRLSIAQLKPAYDSPAALAREHRELLTAIESGKAGTAIALTNQHLEQAIGDLTHRNPTEGRARFG